MLRIDKEKKVDYYSKTIESSLFIFFVDPEKIGIRTMQEIRQRLARLGAKAVYLKNTLARIVFERRGLNQVCEILTGPSLMVTGTSDVSAVAKLVREVQRDSKDQLFKVKGIWFDKKLYSAEEFKLFTSLPSLLESRSTLLGIFRQPTQNFVNILSETRARLVRCLKARSEKAE